MTLSIMAINLVMLRVANKPIMLSSVKLSGISFIVVMLSFMMPFSDAPLLGRLLTLPAKII